MSCLRPQGYELNRNGELYITRNPNLQTKIVDGTSLAAAAVLHMIPEGANAVLLLANSANDKMAFVLSLALCEREVQVGDRTTHTCQLNSQNLD
jgi:aldehyde decarbonylase